MTMPTGYYDRTKARPKRGKNESDDDFRKRLDIWHRSLGYIPIADCDSSNNPPVLAAVQRIEASTETALAEKIADDILERYATQDDITLFWDLVRSITAYKMKKRGLVIPKCGANPSTGTD